jgi:hypothetical protein
MMTSEEYNPKLSHYTTFTCRTNIRRPGQIVRITLHTDNDRILLKLKNDTTR